MPHPHTLNTYYTYGDFQTWQEQQKQTNNKNNPGYFLPTQAGGEHGDRSSVYTWQQVAASKYEWNRPLTIQGSMTPWTPASASTPKKKFYSRSLFPPSHSGFSLLSLDMVTHRWNRLLCEQSALGSCFTEISRHNVCAVTAAQQAWADILHPIPCPAHGPGFPDCCPKASGNGTGSQLRGQEKEGVLSFPSPVPPPPSPMT